MSFTRKHELYNALAMPPVDARVGSVQFIIQIKTN